MRFDLRHGDSREVLQGLSGGSVDALVTDPPAGVAFMGKDWDTFRGDIRQSEDIATSAAGQFNRSRVRYGDSAGYGNKSPRGHFIAALRPIFEECLRVLKPGAHGLVWALPRTSHWTATALEDAGFEIRDRVSHLFGTGFPKSLNLDGGLGTALKPACEDWWLVRKPLDGTVAANVAAHGTGALNIDATRIGTEERFVPPATNDGASPASFAPVNVSGYQGRTVSGRWPANVTLSHNDDCERVGTKRVRASLPASGPTLTGGSNSRARGLFAGTAAAPANYADADGLETVEAWRCSPGCAAALLDEQSGESVSAGGSRGAGGQHGALHPIAAQPSVRPGLGDTGGASRFFYVAKPDRAERDIGCEDLAPASGGEATARVDGTAGLQNPRAGAGRNGGARNIHPTVKSVDLMRWLCRLITPRGGLVLDPFMGSGSTGVACSREGLRFIGIERERQYFEIARRRLVGDAPLLNHIALSLSDPEEAA